MHTHLGTWAERSVKSFALLDEPGGQTDRHAHTEREKEERPECCRANEGAVERLKCAVRC